MRREIRRGERKPLQVCTLVCCAVEGSIGVAGGLDLVLFAMRGLDFLVGRLEVYGSSVTRKSRPS
jgi:hypothetical protein